jgi:hypothetical protein
MSVTFFEGLADGARVENEAGSEFFGVCSSFGRARMAAAAESGGFSKFTVLGKGRNALGFVDAGMRRLV